ncbi:tRNA (guanosine(46)-N7)-methyltransferase TrmB [Mycobacterium sp.]|uniref:tRNA (guanosine(46)-N7)-methyltransferase TrmB n=1 Tax=Mycobacterium sp. TaxID=1785 RepID=UPI003C7096C4
MGNDERMRAQPSVEAAIPPTPSDTLPAARTAGGYRRNTSFRSRRSALSAGQQRTWERLWPELGIVASSGDSPDTADEPLNTAAWFGRDAPLVLEIGCGTGTSTLAMAQSEPDVDVIAAEVYRRGLAQLLSAIERENVTNIRLIRGDAVDVLESLIAPGSLSGVRVFFPDPWPKSRHHKRRLLQPPTVALIADRLRAGGVLHAATDHPGYAEQIAEVGDAEPLLTRVDPAWREAAGLPISVVRPTTKYEGKAQHAGSAVAELVWQRRSERSRP